jgi:hypothetical protein
MRNLLTDWLTLLAKPIVDGGKLSQGSGRPDGKPYFTALAVEKGEKLAAGRAVLSGASPTPGKRTRTILRLCRGRSPEPAPRDPDLQIKPARLQRKNPGTGWLILTVDPTTCLK